MFSRNDGCISNGVFGDKLSGDVPAADILFKSGFNVLRYAEFE